MQLPPTLCGYTALKKVGHIPAYGGAENPLVSAQLQLQVGKPVGDGSIKKTYHRIWMSEMSYIHLKSSAILGELPGYQFPPKKSVVASASDAAGSF